MDFLTQLAALLHPGAVAPQPATATTAAAPGQTNYGQLQAPAATTGNVLARLPTTSRASSTGSVVPQNVQDSLGGLAAVDPHRSKFGAFAQGLAGGMAARQKAESDRQAATLAQLKMLLDSQNTQFQQQLASKADARADAGQKFTQNLDTKKFDLEAKGKDIPAGFKAGPTPGSIVPIPGGPNDPTYLAAKATAEAKADKYHVSVIGEDQFGGKRYGVTNDGTGETKPIDAAPPGATGQPLGATDTPAEDLHGDDFLATLPKGMASQVKAIVEGRAPYPTGMSARSPINQKLAMYVQQADPTFETGNAQARSKVRNEFFAGGPNTPAGSITAGNTALEHLGDLSDAAQKLDNFNTSIPGNNLLNAGKNLLKSSSSAGTALTDYQQLADRFNEEATKFYRGTGGNQADIQRGLLNLSPNMSPDQINAAIATQAKALHDKVDELQNRWRQGMGPLVPDVPIVSKKNYDNLSKIYDRAGRQDQADAASDASDDFNDSAAPGKAAASAAPPDVGANPLEGRTATGPNGVKVINRGGKWVPVTPDAAPPPQPDAAPSPAPDAAARTPVAWPPPVPQWTPAASATPDPAAAPAPDAAPLQLPSAPPAPDDTDSQ